MTGNIGKRELAHRRLSAESVVFPVPDKPKNNVTSPSLLTLHEECSGRALHKGILYLRRGNITERA